MTIAVTNITTVNFTKRWLDTLPAHDAESASREKEYSDTQVIGLKLMVNKKGRKFFYLRYSFNGRKKGMKIGEYGPLTIQQARILANTQKALLAMGKDPQQERDKQKQVPTFKQFVEETYLPHAKANKRSANSDESKLKHHMLPKFGHRQLSEIASLDIQRYHNRIKDSHCASTANRHLSLLSRMFKLANQWDLMESNPARGIKKFQENNQRHRYLSNDELRRFFISLDQESNRVAAHLFAFLLATGARKQEALDAEWSNLDLEKGLWFIPMSKSGKHRHVILNGAAISILVELKQLANSHYVFPGRFAGQKLNNPNKAFKRVLEAAGIVDFRIHDLRHTHASIAINGGATLYEVQHLLGHASSKTTTRYAHLGVDRIREVSGGISERLSVANK